MRDDGNNMLKNAEKYAALKTIKFKKKSNMYWNQVIKPYELYMHTDKETDESWDIFII